MSRISPVTETARILWDDAARTLKHIARRLREGTVLRDDIESLERIAVASFDFAQTPDLEATVGRVMRIRNGMIPDGDAKALIRKEIGALMGSRAQSSKEPVAWRYQGRVGWGDVWRLSEIDPTKTEGFFESPEGWVVQPLFASPDTSTDREARETELPYLKGGLDGY